MLDYIRNGQQIYDLSFATIRKEADLSSIPSDLEKLAVRIIHACGMVDIVDDLVFSDHAGQAGRQALQNAAPILCDSHMVEHGITRKRLPVNNKIICTLNKRETADIAGEMQTTRSAAALEYWRPFLQNSIVAIGNAPTALFRLLEILKETNLKPALILAFPVGFVGALESKEALIRHNMMVPYITLRGRRGGSAMASAAVNALASEHE